MNESPDTPTPDKRRVRFLDIDLDAFLDRVAYSKTTDERLDPEEYKPWPEQQVREFLENGCGLSRQAPVPGRCVVHHDAAFDYWKELVGGSGAQIDVVHVDAHADLGLGDRSWAHLVVEHLFQPVPGRADPPRGQRGLNPGSFLAYAVAARWISSITHVHPSCGGGDFPRVHFKDNDPRSGFLELKGFPADFVESLRWRQKYQELTAGAATTIEPLVPYRATTMESYRACGPFDHALLAQSPGYTPKTADALIPVIGEYIRFECGM